MKPTITKKKLQLAPETVRILSLDDDRLKQVVGGAGNTDNAHCVTGSKYYTNCGPQTYVC